MEQGFRFLRFFSVAIKVLAWLILVASVVGTLVLTVAGGLGSVRMGQYEPLAGMMGGAFMGLLAVVIVFVYFLFLYASSEIVMLFLAIERNTRISAATSAPK